MPRLPEYLAREVLPSVGGVPRSTVAVPVVPQPGVDVQSRTLLERGLESLGTSVQQSAELLVRTETLAGVRQKVQDTLDATTELQDTRPLFQTEYNRLLLEGDYRTLPDDLLREGTRIMQERGQRLTPQARVLYSADAKRALALLHQKSWEVKTQRTQQAVAYAVEREVVQAQQQMYDATTAVDRIAARASLDDLLTRFVGIGVLDGKVAADLYHKTIQSTRLQDLRIAIQADPEAMQTQFLAQTRGVPTREDLPIAPMEHLATLSEEASRVVRERASNQDQIEQRLTRQVLKQQHLAEADLQKRVTEVLPLPENVPLLDALLKETNEKALREDIRLEGQTHLTGLLRTLRSVAVNPPQIDDLATERRLAILLNAADNTADYEHFKNQVIEHAPRLKVDTMKAFLAMARERDRADHWSTLPGVKVGLRYIYGGDVGVASLLSSMRGITKEEDEVRLRTAGDTYLLQIQEIAEGVGGKPGSRAEANARGPELGLEIRKRLVDMPSQETSNAGLPPPLQKITDLEQAMDIIQRLPGTRAQKGELLRRWRVIHPEASSTFPFGGAPPPGTGGTQPPRTTPQPPPPQLSPGMRIKPEREK